MKDIIGVHEWFAKPLQKDDARRDNGETTNSDRQISVHNEQNEDVRCTDSDVDIWREDVHDRQAVNGCDATAENETARRLNGCAECALDGNDKCDAQKKLTMDGSGADRRERKSRATLAGRDVRVKNHL